MLHRASRQLSSRSLAAISRGPRVFVQRRSQSTEAAGDKDSSVVLPEDYKGSSNYVPGKQGYAPGFPPPKNWRDAPRPRPAPMLPSDLAPPSPKQNYVPKYASAAENPARLYKQKMKQLRYQYMHEHLVNQDKKREMQKKNLEKIRKVHIERKQRMYKERMEYETKIRADPLSAENVLNAEGKTLLSNIPGDESMVDQSQEAKAKKEKLRDLEVGYKLAPPCVSISMPKEANELRAKERDQNRKLMEDFRREKKVQALMTLYHESASFVHYHNMAKKIQEFLVSLSSSHRTVNELLTDLELNGDVTTSAESARRTVELRNTLTGTTGSASNPGLDSLVEWLDAHPEDADGVIDITKK